eukprot:COSAG01_NODE_54872_length_329_cov_0.673913_1_plen_35_part_01
MYSCTCTGRGTLMHSTGVRAGHNTACTQIEQHPVK